MKAERVRKLYEQVEWIAANFTDIKTRTFLDFEKIIQVTPISDSGAVSIHEKKSDGKWGLFFFLWLEREGKFVWWPPSDSDLLFLSRAQSYREKVEGHNLLIVTGKIL